MSFKSKYLSIGLSVGAFVLMIGLMMLSWAPSKMETATIPKPNVETSVASAREIQLLASFNDAQQANISRIHLLAFATTTCFEWPSTQFESTVEQLAIWQPSTGRFLATDPYPNERDNSWLKKPISVSLFFGGTDNQMPIWETLTRHAMAQATNIYIDEIESSPASYIITGVYGEGGTSNNIHRLFVEWHVRKENCFNPHLVIMKNGFDKANAKLVHRSQLSFQKVNGTILPKMANVKHYDGKGELQYQKKVVVNRISTNTKLDPETVLDSESLSTKMLFGDSAEVEPMEPTGER